MKTKQIMEGFTNEEVFEDALTMGLTPDDPDVIAGGYSEAFGEYIAEKERKESMRTTGAQSVVGGEPFPVGLSCWWVLSGHFGPIRGFT